MAPLRDEEFSSRVESALPSPEQLSGRVVILSLERDTMSHTAELIALLSEYENSQKAVVRIISTCKELFATALSVLPRELANRNAIVLNHCMNANQLRIKTSGGTDLKVSIDSERHRWISNRGSARPGATVILPAGEVATFPHSISGKHVADFAFNINAITDRDARLDQSPVTLWIEDGCVQDFECDDRPTYSFVEECLKTLCVRNVGELGFGTNPMVNKPIAMNSHINERRPGVHLGFGQHNQSPKIVNYQCHIHLDLISRGGLIWADDEPYPIDLENLPDSNSIHPASPSDEDVFSPSSDDFEDQDCCGTLTSGDIDMPTVGSSE